MYNKDFEEMQKEVDFVKMMDVREGTEVVSKKYFETELDRVRSSSISMEDLQSYYMDI